MNKEMEQMRDFLSAEIKKREFEQEQLDKLAEVLYPHDGSNESVLAATRKFSLDMMGWVEKSNEKKERKAPKPLTDAEIEELAAML